jgi:phage terminase large subunit-like protein
LYAHAVRNQAENNDPNFGQVLYYLPDTQDWKCKENWHKTMPALGDFVSEKYVESKFQEAQYNTSGEFAFRTLYLNQFLDNSISFVDLLEFDKCYSEIEPSGECVLAIDLSSTIDMTAVALVSKDNKAARVFYFMPANTVAKERSNRPKLDAWCQQGWVEKSDDTTVDYQQVRAKIKELCGKYWITKILMDPWNAHSLARQLVEEDYLPVEYLKPTRETLNAPTKDLQRRILNKQIFHDGNPVLRWNFGNLRLEIDRNENFYPTKSKSTGKIDGAWALIIASSLLPFQTASCYEQDATI